MASSQKQQLNRTKDQEIECSCSKCSGKPYHRVLLSIDVDGQEDHDQYDFQWEDHFQIIQCQGCKTFSFRHTHSTSEDWDTFDESIGQENLYPSRVDGRVGISDGLIYVPATVQRIYKETLQALNARSHILAGIGLRALAETVCKEKNAKGSDLYTKIDNLIAKNVLTPAGAKILHRIRTLGNQAAHEVKPHTDKQLELAMEVVEHLIKDVYIIPKQVEVEFGQDESTQNDDEVEHKVPTGSK